MLWRNWENTQKLMHDATDSRSNEPPKEQMLSAEKSNVIPLIHMRCECFTMRYITIHTLMTDETGWNRVEKR